jgi:diguanylate cyclase (GGDEF)-like protein
MMNIPESKLRVRAPQAKTLNKALEQNKQAKHLVTECAEELSSVNTVLNDELAGEHQPPVIEEALEKSASIECKVQEVGEQLAVVNHALHVEVNSRQRLEQRLATVTHDKEVADHAALHDPLSGLPNRVLFDERLAYELAQAKQQGAMLAVMFMDLDGFKKINDTHGHDVGDVVLKTVADRLQQHTRAGDTVSRQGGDEFLYLMREVVDDKAAMDFAEQILTAIQEPCQLDIGELIIKPSIGVSMYPKHGSIGSDLVKTADKAMYEAKQNQSGFAFAK